MDSTAGHRYSHAMRLLRCILAFAILAPVPAVTAAAPVVLAELEYKSGLFGDRSPIYDRAGGSPSPYSRKPKKVWTLKPGDTIRQNNPPPERLIRFYETVNNSSLSICTIIVKYARVSGGWRPAYQLLTHPLVTLENGRLKPLGTDEGVRGMVQIVSHSEPNRDGFFHSLSFGLVEGNITIDSWEVQ